MSNTKDKTFADGFKFERRSNSPDFVVGKLSVAVEDAVKFLRNHESAGWVNLDIKRAKSGNFYMELNTWKPEGVAPTTATVQDDLPF